MSVGKNEQKSAEYVPYGPVRVSRKLGERRGGTASASTSAAVAENVPAAHVDDTERMRQAHAKRMEATLGSPDHFVGTLPASTSAQSSPESADIGLTPAGREPVIMVDVLGLSDEAKLSADNVRGLIVQECRATEALLLAKNAGYGSSAFDPLRVFSKVSAVTGILVRIDDKLSRIARGDLTAVDDEKLPQTVDDLIGYLTLLKVAWRLKLT
jgi:hypothetical protein